MSNAFEKEMAHKIIALEERLEALEKLYSSIDHLFQRIEALEEKFDKLMKLSDDYYKTDRTVIYDYANKIEALEAELENNKYKEEDEWLEGK